jgi:hypothetical protein
LVLGPFVEPRSGGAFKGCRPQRGDKHLAFALALVLDELALHLRDLRPEVREQTLRGARMLIE